MLKIRLQRVGRKHEPVFRVVLTDSQNSTKSGKFLEVLGSYDPRRDVDSFNTEAIKDWISKGAQPSDTMHNLLVKHKVIEGKKRNVLPKKSPIKKEGEDAPVEASAEAPAPVEASAEAPAEESAPEATPTPEPTPETAPDSESAEETPTEEKENASESSEASQ